MNYRYFFITVDYNDADYISTVVAITEEQFKKFLPLMEAINNYQPYIAKLDVDYNNWDSIRQDLYEKRAEQKYPQFSKELIKEFREAFYVHTPEGEYYPTGCSEFHSIINIQEITLGKRYVAGAYEDVKDRNKEVINDYHEKYNKLMNYRRPKDNMPLNSIPYNKMTKEEYDRVTEANNLWMKYRDDLQL